MTAATNTITVPESAVGADASGIKRVAVFAYGIISYGAGVTALVAWILVMLGVLPFTGGPIAVTGAAAAIVNVGLMLGFGLQHSIMARPSFKKKWTSLIPVAAERSSFILATGIVLGGMLLVWQPMGTTVWEVHNPTASWALIGVSLFGWAYLFLASFAINHFELFGLRQVHQFLRGREVTGVPFKERMMYRFDRHPIMTGALIGMWVTPVMRVDHLLFAGLATVYIVIGVWFEERALLREWGEVYEKYKARVPSIVPTLSSPKLRP